ncbi:hypothetical protein L3X38_041959 [Prunus dulcis]|uniref:Uncharacterized protein n=1 Tax=Prunus dulcis TaxID=3755 RepID=A0AAD4UTY6_PRUDU|nr:hypothetical protein L3X38_041959 [Prunus dulcis]
MTAEQVSGTPGIKKMRFETRLDFLYSTALGHGHEASMSLSPLGIRRASLREEIDTSTPFESIEEAVTHFGDSGIIHWSKTLPDLANLISTDCTAGYHGSDKRAAEGVGVEEEVQMSLGYCKEQMDEVVLVHEFKNQAPRVLRKVRTALGSTLVPFINKIDNCYISILWLGLRSLWHGS